MPLRYRSPLTKREKEVLDALADGLTAQQVGERLGISIKTVEAHRQHAYLRLGASGLKDAVQRERLAS